VMGMSVGIGLAGILLAVVIYARGLGMAERLARALRPFHTASINKLWFDEFYDIVFIRPFKAVARLLFRFDQQVVDGLVNGAGRGTGGLSRLHQLFDQYVIDGLVNFTGYFTQWWSAVIRRAQTGLVQNYLLIVFSGVILLLYFGMH